MGIVFGTLVISLVVLFSLWLAINAAAQERKTEEAASSPGGLPLSSRQYTVVSMPNARGYCAHVLELPGFVAYGETAQGARRKACAMALSALASKIMAKELSPQGIEFVIRAESSPAATNTSSSS